MSEVYWVNCVRRIFLLTSLAYTCFSRMLLGSPLIHAQTPALPFHRSWTPVPLQRWCMPGTTQASQVAKKVKKTSNSGQIRKEVIQPSCKDFSKEQHFDLEWKGNWQTIAIRAFGRAFFSKVNKISLSLQGKQLTVLLPMINPELQSKSQNFEKISIYHDELDSLPELKRLFWLNRCWY